jgi:hypothetical protein
MAKARGIVSDRSGRLFSRNQAITALTMAEIPTSPPVRARSGRSCRDRSTHPANHRRVRARPRYPIATGVPEPLSRCGF